jgi:hypothetical protein
MYTGSLITSDCCHIEMFCRYQELTVIPEGYQEFAKRLLNFCWSVMGTLGNLILVVLFEELYFR